MTPLLFYALCPGAQKENLENKTAEGAAMRGLEAPQAFPFCKSLHSRAFLLS